MGLPEIVHDCRHFKPTGLERRSPQNSHLQAMDAVQGLLGLWRGLPAGVGVVDDRCPHVAARRCPLTHSRRDEAVRHQAVALLARILQAQQVCATSPRLAALECDGHRCS